MSQTPEGFHSITPHFVVRDAEAAIKQYEAAFGAEATYVMKSPDGQSIMHAELRIGSSMLFLSDPFDGGDRNPPADNTLSSCAFYHYVEDVDAAYKKAVEAGLTGKSAPEDMFWGDRTAVVVDDFGYNWTLSTHVRDVSEEEIQEAIKQFG